MKKILILLALLFPSIVFAQKIEKNEVDKFTKLQLIETSMEKIGDYNKWKSLIPDCSEVKVAIRKSGEKWYMLAFLATNSCEKYTEDDGLVLLLDNDEVITLQTLYTGLPSSGPYGAKWVFSTVFELTDDVVEKLKAHKIVSVRLEYLGGHKDFDIPKKRMNKVIKMFKLIEDELQK